MADSSPPISTPEHERLDAQHRAFADLMGGKVFHAPLSHSFPAAPRRILDLGCGTDLFTAQLSRLFPTAQVVGVDLSPVPTDRHGQLPNLRYLRGDAAALLRSGELEAGSFDYVFERLLILGVAGWPAHLRDVVVPLLAPGGVCELQEYDSMARAGPDWPDDGPEVVAYGDELGPSWQWHRFWMADAAAIGLNMRAGRDLATELLPAAGVEVVSADVHDIPHGGPPSLRGAREDDEYWGTVVDTFWGCVERHSGPRRSPEVLANMKKEYHETFVRTIQHSICKLHVVVARKPVD